jgi:hypothetical protein
VPIFGDPLVRRCFRLKSKDRAPAGIVLHLDFVGRTVWIKCERIRWHLPRSPTVSGALQVGAASEQERRIRSGVALGRRLKA